MQLSFESLDIRSGYYTSLASLEVKLGRKEFTPRYQILINISPSEKFVLNTFFS